MTIRSLPEALAVIKEMQGQDYEWGEDYRAAGRAALAARGTAGRRNGAYSRWLLSELGRIGLSVPRTRHFSPHPVVRAYARRADHIDRMVLACFVLGLIHAQGRQGTSAGARHPGEREHREPGRQDPRCRRRRLPRAPGSTTTMRDLLSRCNSSTWKFVAT